MSTTSPLYALLLGLLRFIGFDIPWTSNIIGCCCLGVGAGTLWALFNRWHWSVAATVVLLLYPLSPLLILTVGLETTFSLALILLGVLAYEHRRYRTAAVLFGLATLTRFDAALALAVVVAYDLVTRRHLPPWRLPLTYIVTIVPWLIFAVVYYGSPLPATLAAKRLQALLPASESFLEGLPRFFAHYSSPLFWPHLFCAVLGACATFVVFRRSVVLLGWSIAYGCAYIMLGVTRYAWYYAPLVVGLLILIALGVQAVYIVVRKRWGDRIGWQVAIALCVLLLAGQVSTFVSYYHVENGRLRIYREVGQWFNANTEPNASIGALEIGIIGFYSERRMIDFAGLLQPKTALQFSATSGYEDAAIWSAEHFKPNYVLLHDGFFPRLEAMLAERGGCGRLNAWSDPHYTARLVAYGCSWR